MVICILGGFDVKHDQNLVKSGYKPHLMTFLRPKFGVEFISDGFRVFRALFDPEMTRSCPQDGVKMSSIWGHLSLAWHLRAEKSETGKNILV